MLNTLDKLIAAFPGQQKRFLKFVTFNSKTGAWLSFWTSQGNPGLGSAPGNSNGFIHTSSTLGAISFTNPPAGQISYLAMAESAGSSQGTLVIYDRLWANSGFSGTSTTLNSFTAPTLTRYTSGSEVELWLEVYSTIGSTASIATASYTNQAGTTNSATCNIAGGSTHTQGEMIPFSLASGDSGVRSVNSVQLNASTGTVGNYGLTLLYRIAEIPVVSAYVTNSLDFITLGMPQIQDNACIAIMGLCNSTLFSNQMGILSIVQG